MNGMDKILPHSVQHEQRVLVNMYIERHNLDDIQEVLEAEDFYRDEHKLIFNAIISALRKKPYVFLGDIKRELEGKVLPKGLGAYINDLFSRDSLLYNVGGTNHSVEIVYGMSIARKEISNGK